MKKKEQNWFEKLCMMDEETEETRPTAKQKKSDQKSKPRKEKIKRNRSTNLDSTPYDDVGVIAAEPIDDSVFDDTIYVPISPAAALANRNSNKSKNESDGNGNGEKSRKRLSAPLPQEPKPDKPPKPSKPSKTAQTVHSGDLLWNITPYIELVFGLLLATSFILSFILGKGVLPLTEETHPFRWVGYHFDNLLFGLFGFAAYLLPVVLLYLAINRLSGKQVYGSGVMWGLGGGIATLFTTVIHACLLNTQTADLQTWNFLELYRLGAARVGGGIVGGYLGRLAYDGLGVLGTVLIALTAMLFMLIFFFNSTPAQLVAKMKKKKQVSHDKVEALHKADAERYAQMQKEAAQKQQLLRQKRLEEAQMSAAPRDGMLSAASNAKTVFPAEDCSMVSIAQSMEMHKQSAEPLVEPMAEPVIEATPEEPSFKIPRRKSQPDKPESASAAVDPVKELLLRKREADARREKEAAAMSAERNSRGLTPEEVFDERIVAESPIEPAAKDTAAASVRVNTNTVSTVELVDDTAEMQTFDGDGTLTARSPAPDMVAYPESAEIDIEDDLPSEGVFTPEILPREKQEPKKSATDGYTKSGISFTKMDDCTDGFNYGEPDVAQETIDADAETVETKTVGGVEIKTTHLSEKEKKAGEKIVSDEELRDSMPEKKPYVFPTPDLLVKDKPRQASMEDEIRETVQQLSDTLTSFKVRIENISYVCGPAITRYEVRPAPGVRVRTIANLVDDISLGLAATGIRIEAPIAGKNAVGIEVPNKERESVALRTLIDAEEFRTRPSKLTSALGKDVAGKPIYLDVAKMPHLLIAGTTGSGKSVCINSVIMSILYKATAEEVKLILIDPKTVEFSVYQDIPHLLAPIVCDPKRAAAALNLAVQEMESRFEKMRMVGTRDIAAYNTVTANDRYEHPFLPQIVIIIDELNDLMMSARDDVESSICRLAQKSRAAGMHLIIGTQRPSVDVITGLIKSNVPSRIAFTVASQVDSRTILDVAGAEKLIGRGDMLYAPVGAPKPLRVQGCYVSDEEVIRVVDFIKRKNEPVKYDQDFIAGIDREAQMIGNKRGSVPDDDDDDEDGARSGNDPKFYEALRIAVDNKRISTSLLMRMLGLGYGRAAKIIDQMERAGYVGHAVGNKPREILITDQQYAELMVSRDE